MCYYYKFREHNKSYYEKVRPADLKFIGEANILTCTPYRDQKGHRILIYRFGMWKTSEINIEDIFRASVCLLELGSMEPIGQVVGGVGIFDLKDFTLNHVLHLSPSVAQKMIAMLVVSFFYVKILDCFINYFKFRPRCPYVLLLYILLIKIGFSILLSIFSNLFWMLP